MYDFGTAAMAMRGPYASVAIIAIIAAIMLSRWLDKRAGINFAAELTRITSEPISAAVYFGARILG